MGGAKQARQHAQTVARDDFCTPIRVLRPVWAMLHSCTGQVQPDLDPASNPRSIVSAKREIWLPKYAQHVDTVNAARPGGSEGSRREAFVGDGLTYAWAQHRSVFVNHPYGRGVSRRWAKKCYEEAQVARHTFEDFHYFLLTPASICTKWWDYCWGADAQLFFRGRLGFLGAPEKANGEPVNADFESALVYYGTAPDRFADFFAWEGRVVTSHAYKYTGASVS